MQRLPTNMQISLIVSGENHTLDDLAALADKLHRMMRSVFNMKITPVVVHPGIFGKDARFPSSQRDSTASRHKDGEQSHTDTENRVAIHQLGRSHHVADITNVSARRAGNAPRHAVGTRRSLRKINA